MAITKTRAFSLIEILITIAIMGLMLGLLVPIVDRSLGKNRVANDVELLRAKLEEVRILAGSTQLNDEIPATDPNVKDQAGYYALFLPGAARADNYFAIIRLSDPFNLASSSSNYCSAATAVNHADPGYNPGQGERYCLVERVALSNGVKMVSNNRPDRLVVFKVPSRQLFELVFQGSEWVFAPEPLFDWSAAPFQLTFSNKTATVSLESYSAKLRVQY